MKRGLEGNDAVDLRALPTAGLRKRLKTLGLNSSGSHDLLLYKLQRHQQGLVVARARSADNTIMKAMDGVPYNAGLYMTAAIGHIFRVPMCVIVNVLLPELSIVTVYCLAQTCRQFYAVAHAELAKRTAVHPVYNSLRAISLFVHINKRLAYHDRFRFINETLGLSAKDAGKLGTFLVVKRVVHKHGTVDKFWNIRVRTSAEPEAARAELEWLKSHSVERRREIDALFRDYTGVSFDELSKPSVARLTLELLLGYKKITSLFTSCTKYINHTSASWTAEKATHVLYQLCRIRCPILAPRLLSSWVPSSCPPAIKDVFPEVLENLEKNVEYLGGCDVALRVARQCLFDPTVPAPCVVGDRMACTKSLKIHFSHDGETTITFSTNPILAKDTDKEGIALHFSFP